MARSKLIKFCVRTGVTLVGGKTTVLPGRSFDDVVNNSPIAITVFDSDGIAQYGMLVWKKVQNGVVWDIEITNDDETLTNMEVTVTCEK